MDCIKHAAQSFGNESNFIFKIHDILGDVLDTTGKLIHTTTTKNTDLLYALLYTFNRLHYHGHDGSAFRNLRNGRRHELSHW